MVYSIMDYVHLFQALLAGTTSKLYQFHKGPGQLAIILLDTNINAKHSVYISAFFFQSIVVFKELERKTLQFYRNSPQNVCN